MHTTAFNSSLSSIGEVLWKYGQAHVGVKSIPDREASVVI